MGCGLNRLEDVEKILKMASADPAYEIIGEKDDYWRVVHIDTNRWIYWALHKGDGKWIVGWDADFFEKKSS